MNRAYDMLMLRSVRASVADGRKHLHTSRSLGRQIGYVAAAVASAISVVSCGGGGDGFVNPPPVVLTFSPASGSVNVGATTSFEISITGGSPVPTLASCRS